MVLLLEQAYNSSRNKAAILQALPAGLFGGPSACGDACIMIQGAMKNSQTQMTDAIERVNFGSNCRKFSGDGLASLDAFV
jgi:hypothetical protein